MKDRREAVLSLLCREEPGAVIARHYGVSETSLYRWRDEFLAAGEAALAGGTRGKDDGPPIWRLDPPMRSMRVLGCHARSGWLYLDFVVKMFGVQGEVTAWE